MPLFTDDAASGEAACQDQQHLLASAAVPTGAASVEAGCQHLAAVAPLSGH